jgi:alanine racemase
VVDSYPEYMLVKKYSKKNILLLGETLPQNYKRFDHRRTTFCVFNIDAIKAIAKLKRKSTIHLFFNTGMHREGIDINQIQDALDIISKYKHLTLE